MARGRLVAVAVAVALLAACGGESDDDPPSGLSADGQAAVRRVEDAAEAIARNLDDGFAGVVYALDSGYSTGQIIEAGLDGRLSSTGEITGPDGSVTTPDGEGFDLIAAASVDGAAGPLLGTLLVARTGAAPTSSLPPFDMQSLREHADILAFSSVLGQPSGDEVTDTKLEGFRTILLVLLMSDSGYTFEQIIEQILLGSISEEPSPDSEDDPCIGFLDAAGEAVSPSGPAGERAVALGCPRPGAAPDLPVEDTVPEGALQIVFTITSVDAEDGASVVMDGTGTFVVADDGTVTGTALGLVQTQGACFLEGLEEERHPYEFFAEVEVAITGTKATAYNLVLAIQSAGEPTRTEGDDSLCVDVAGDIMRGIIDPENRALEQSVTIPLELGRFELPTTIIAGEAPATLVITVEKP